MTDKAVVVWGQPPPSSSEAASPLAPLSLSLTLSWRVRVRTGGLLWYHGVGDVSSVQSAARGPVASGGGDGVWPGQGRGSQSEAQETDAPRLQAARAQRVGEHAGRQWTQ